jgi:hypothetical protein
MRTPKPTHKIKEAIIFSEYGYVGLILRTVY